MAKWNLDDLYSLDEEDKLIENLKKEVDEFKSLRAKLDKISVEKFIEIIKKSEKISRISSKLTARAQLKLCENTSDSDSNAKLSMLSQICTELGNEMIFFNLWFKSLSDEKASEYINNAGEYRYFLERIRALKKYTLNEKEEQIINIKDLTGEEAITNLYNIIASKFRFEWEGKKIGTEELNQYRRDPNKEKRKKCYNLFLAKFEEEHSVLGEIYATIVKDWNNEHIKIRKYSSPISVRNISNDIEDETVKVLLNVAEKNKRIFQEYFKLKAKICNLDKIDRYDIYAPLNETEKEYTYEESKKITLETYKDFSKEAYKMAKMIFDDNHVHSEIIENKKTGAFCYSVTKDLSPYILLNHTNKIRDLSTMVHETGHGIHSLAARNQTEFTFHSTLPMAETASTFGEMLLVKKMLREASKDEKIEILMNKLDDHYATIMRQAFFVIFEIEAHKRIMEGANIEELNQIYLTNLSEQFGNAVKVPDIFKHEWKSIPHIYHTPFYCYAYSFGELLVLALFKMYEEEGESFVAKYMKILSYGGSKKTSEILKEIGINISKESFWQKGFDCIKEEIEELKSLVKNN